MKNLLKEVKKVKFAIDEKLANVDVTQVAPKKLEEANKYVTKLKLPTPTQ